MNDLVPHWYCDYSGLLTHNRIYSPMYQNIRYLNCLYYCHQELEKSYNSKSWESAAILGVPDHKKRALLSAAYQFPPISDMAMKYEVSLSNVLNDMSLNFNDLKEFAPTFCDLHFQEYEKLRILTDEGYECSLKIALILNNEENIAYSPFLMMSIILLLVFLSKEEVLFVIM